MTGQRLTPGLAFLATPADRYQRRLARGLVRMRQSLRLPASMPVNPGPRRSTQSDADAYRVIKTMRAKLHDPNRGLRKAYVREIVEGVQIGQDEIPDQRA